MAIADLFDHRVQVWRPVQTRGAYSEVVDTWDVVELGDRDNAALVPARKRLEDPGPGEAEAGRVEWYLGIWVDVAERDILSVTNGANAPSTWKVVSVTTPSGRRSLGLGGHHREVVVEPWQGELPEEES